jgi:hypothetical protein
LESYVETEKRLTVREKRERFKTVKAWLDDKEKKRRQKETDEA